MSLCSANVSREASFLSNHPYRLVSMSLTLSGDRKFALGIANTNVLYLVFTSYVIPLYMYFLRSFFGILVLPEYVCIVTSSPLHMLRAQSFPDLCISNIVNVSSNCGKHSWVIKRHQYMLALALCSWCRFLRLLIRGDSSVVSCEEARHDICSTVVIRTTQKIAIQSRPCVVEKRNYTSLHGKFSCSVSHHSDVEEW